MKRLRSIFHFLGSVYLAIALIAAAALIVIVGTFIEARTGSHLYAAQYTYNHPGFIFLLWLFFVNILVSALRRWPFKKRHIPFLVTHLGLLMVISGVIIKNQYGIQGNMNILEGSANHSIVIPHSFALQIQNREGATASHLLAESLTAAPQFPDLKIKIDGYFPHVKEEWQSWIKGDFAWILGLPPIPVQTWLPGQEAPQLKEYYLSPDPNPWNIVAIRTNFPEKIFELARHNFEGKSHLFIIENDQFEQSIKAFNSHGREYQHSFSKDTLNSLLVYDHGYHGYGVQVKIPFHSDSGSDVEIEKASGKILTSRLKTLFSSTPILSPPLELIKNACVASHVDFAETLVSFLQHWDASREILFSNKNFISPDLTKVIDRIRWDSISSDDLQSCYWTQRLFRLFAQASEEGQNLTEFLKNNRWPLEVPNNENSSEFMTTVAQQLFSIAPHLPMVDSLPPEDIHEQIELLSAYLKVFEIEYSNLKPSAEEALQALPPSSIVLETTLAAKHIPISSTQKIEENNPNVKLELVKGSKKEHISLAYDPNLNGLKWPVLDGKYLIRFQPKQQEIPYKIRLRQARQINYAHSQQPYSYECDILISSLDQPYLEKTLSMNRVHETWDGFRFYLSGMNSGSESPIKQVQIVVNHDPAKYYLTYPGGVIVSIGIILLFWMRPYRKND